MARKKWVIDERVMRTPEERKRVESELNRERTPEELKKAVLGLHHATDPGGANWMIWFNKKISARLPTCMMESEIFWKEVEEESEYIKSHFSEIKKGIIDIIKQNPQEWEIKEEKVSRIELEGLPKKEWKSKEMVVREKGIIGGKHHSKNGFTKEEWAEIENALNHNKSSMPVIRKCGFSDCEKRISWEATECNNCWNRKENYICDACCQKQSYNIAFLIGVRDNLNDTEIALKRVRGLITKLPKFYDKLKEVEKSLILTVAEEEAIEKKKSFRINFLHEKNHGRQRDNIHLFKLCRSCLDELIEKEEQFTQENLDVKKMGEKWERNQFEHSKIFGKIAGEIGLEEWNRICDENNKELGLKVEEEKNSEKEKLPERWPCPNYQEEGIWEMLEGCIKGNHEKEKKPNKRKDKEKPQYDNDIELEKIKKIFQEHHINKITFENGQLSIEYDNNSVEKPVNNSEFQTLRKYCQEHNEKGISRQKLGISSDNASPSQNNPKPSNNHLAIILFCGTLLVAVLVVAIRLVVKKRKTK